MQQPFPGILIAFEGIDGAGKTTQAKLLADFLESVGESVVSSKEPTDGVWGQKIKSSAASGRMPLSEELHAFLEDRREHLQAKVLPALAAGKTVILDRFLYSTIAYQGSRGGKADAITPLVLKDVPEPDAVILLDVSPAVGLERIAESRKQQPNAFENSANLKAVRNAFLELAKAHPNISVIDGTPNQQHVQWQVLKSLLDGALLNRHCAKPWDCADPFNCAYRITGTCRWADLMAASGAIKKTAGQ